MKPVLHDPRPYLLGDSNILNLGEFNADGFAAGKGYDQADLLRQLNREQRADFTQAKKEGFHPVLLLDLETGVVILEMRKPDADPERHARDGV